MNAATAAAKNVHEYAFYLPRSRYATLKERAREISRPTNVILATLVEGFTKGDVALPTLAEKAPPHIECHKFPLRMPREVSNAMYARARELEKPLNRLILALTEGYLDGDIALPALPAKAEPKAKTPRKAKAKATTKRARIYATTTPVEVPAAGRSRIYAMPEPVVPEPVAEPEPVDPFAALTAKQREVVELVKDLRETGFNYSDLGRVLGITANAAELRLRSIYKSLGIKNMDALVALIIAA